MPEGPEVGWMVHNLQKYVGSTITKITPTLKLSLPSKILSITNKGKTIWIQLDNDQYVKILPSMTGMLTDSTENVYSGVYHLGSPENYIRYTFDLADQKKIFFIDPRKFGKITPQTPQEKEENENIKLGPYPIHTPLTSELVAAITARWRKSPNREICDILLDQNIISGVGNYIRADALYLSQVPPMTKIKDLDDDKLHEIIKNTWKIMIKSYKTQLKNGFHSYEFVIYNNPEAKQYKTKGRTVWW